MRSYEEFSKDRFPEIDELCKTMIPDDGEGLRIACHTMAEMSELYPSYSDEADAFAAIFGQARANCMKHLQMTPERAARLKRLKKLNLDLNIWQKCSLYVVVNCVMLYRIIKAWLCGDYQEYREYRKSMNNLK